MAVLEKLSKVIVERLGVNENEVTLDASFKEDLGADSLDVVELIMEIEDVFEIEVSDADAEGMTKVGDVVSYLEKNIG